MQLIFSGSLMEGQRTQVVNNLQEHGKNPWYLLGRVHAGNGSPWSTSLCALLHPWQGCTAGYQPGLTQSPALYVHWAHRLRARLKDSQWNRGKQIFHRTLLKKHNLQVPSKGARSNRQQSIFQFSSLRFIEPLPGLAASSVLLATSFFY